jgi:hypothetical protein
MWVVMQGQDLLLVLWVEVVPLSGEQEQVGYL